MSRAARLAGVSRGDLQEKIRGLALATFEGSISVEDLLVAYPHIDMERDPILERVESIKAKAHPKRHYSDNWLPEPEVLMARIQDFQDVLSSTKAALNSARQLLGEVATRLETAADAPPQELRQSLGELAARLRQAEARADQLPDREARLFAKDALLRILCAGVRLLPSGREFFVEGRDSLLDSALKAGLHLAYGCSSGNCGACKVRVAAGEVRKIRDHDFILSAQERAAGYILACSNTAVTDLVLEAAEANTAADLPQQQIRCSLRRIETLAEGLLLVQVQTPRTQTLRFLAGQRVELTAENGSRRELPLASCPCDARNLQFLVPQHPEPGLAEALLASGRAASVLVDGPRGSFLLEEGDTSPALFIAVDQGLGPIKSLVEQAIATDNAARLQLYRVDTLTPGNTLDNLCRAWNDALDNFGCRRLAPTTRPAELLDTLERDLPRLKDFRVYVAGPTPWVDEFSTLAQARGMDGARLRYDRVD
jgi:CDP-4-dehydro-6-deoxyglucose reductase